MGGYASLHGGLAWLLSRYYDDIPIGRIGAQQQLSGNGVNC